MEQFTYCLFLFKQHIISTKTKEKLKYNQNEATTAA